MMVPPAVVGCIAARNPRAQAMRTVTSINLARMVEESGNIVLARVTRATPEPHPQFRNLNTVAVTLDVVETLKGSPGREFVFRQYVADIFESKSTQGYRMGEEILLFLHGPSTEGLTSPVGFEQGRFRVERDTAGSRVVRNGMDNIGLFEGMDATDPGLARVSPEVRRMVSEHRGGAIAYDSLKAAVEALVSFSRTSR
jgi:hypothetical protein